MVKRPSRAIIIITAVAILAAYVVPYIPLTLLGDYEFSQSGKLRYRSTGMSVSDIVMWMPKYCRYQSEFKSISGEYISRGNWLGYFYSPMIRIDRWLFHPTKSVREAESEGR